MLFRPEEVHAGSTPGPGFWRSPYLTVGVAHDAHWVDREHLLVVHLDHQVFATIQTGGVDPYRLAGKQPAHRQRLEASLGKPLLLAVDTDAVLRRQVVEGRKRDEIIRLRVQPGRDATAHQIMESCLPSSMANPRPAASSV